MSLDITFTEQFANTRNPSQTLEHEVGSFNITHNLREMAIACGVYDCLWRPEENGFTQAKQLTPKLVRALTLLDENPEYYRQFDAPNGWGKLENFKGFLMDVLKCCKEHPFASVSSDR